MHGIDDLLARYCFAIDGGDTAAWLDCFEDEATFRSVSAEGVHVDLHGRAQLAEWIERYAATFAPWSVKHVLTGRSFELDGDEAVGTTGYLTLTAAAAGGGITVQTAGRYLDRVRRDPSGRWRFQSRTAQRDLGSVPR